MVRLGAAVAATASLLALVLGVSRTVLAMARDGHLPRPLAAVHPYRRLPHRADLVIGALVVIATLVGDIRTAIGFSSFCVLVYYALTNASAWTLGGGPGRLVPAAGLTGCLLIAASLPTASVVSGGAVLAAGAALWIVRRLRHRPDGG